MLSEVDEKLLKEACKTCIEASQHIQSVLSKVEDEDLSDDLNRQLGKYISFIKKAEKKLKNEGRETYEESIIDRMKIWSKIQRSTLFNNSTKHIADLLIEDNSKGIAYMLKAMHDYPMSECCEFARELVEFEEQNVKQLKYYLSQEE